MSGPIGLGSLLGIPLRVNPSWLIIFAAVTYFLVAVQFPALFPSWQPAAYLVAGLVTSILFFASVILHELAHSVVARSLGIPVHSITLFVFGGVAQVARDPVHPAGELLMAAAGPLTSFALAVLFACLSFTARFFHEPTAVVAGILAGLNLSLAIFNMLPGYPMDGGRVFRSLVWWATGDQAVATTAAHIAGRLIAWLLIIAGFTLVLIDTRNLVNGLWIAFIGWFLGQAVSGSARQTRARKRLAGYSARDLMAPDLSCVPPDVTLDQIVGEYLGDRPRRWLLVARDGRFLGLLSSVEMERIPRGRWGHVTASQAMTPIDQIPVVSPLAGAADLLGEMEEHRSLHAAVVHNRMLLGIVAQRSILAGAGRPL